MQSRGVQADRQTGQQQQAARTSCPGLLHRAGQQQRVRLLVFASCHELAGAVWHTAAINGAARREESLCRRCILQRTRHPQGCHDWRQPRRRRPLSLSLCRRGCCLAAGAGGGCGGCRGRGLAHHNLDLEADVCLCQAQHVSWVQSNLLVCLNVRPAAAEGRQGRQTGKPTSKHGAGR